MTRRRWLGLAAAAVVVTPGRARAHITPPVVLLSEREAVAALLAGARRFFVREISLDAGQRDTIQRAWRWRPDENVYRFYIGRDQAGALVASAVFVTEVTVHGPVRVAVGLGPDGRVRGARIVEVTEETYTWVKPLADADLDAAVAGRDASSPLALPVRAPAGSMTDFYAQVIGSLVQRAAILASVAGIH